MTDTLQPLRRNLGTATEAVDNPPKKTDGVIRWAPVNFTRRLSLAGADYVSVREALTKVFGPFPIKLEFDADNVAHANILRAMAAVAGPQCEPYEDLYTALKKYHGIVITEK